MARTRHDTSAQYCRDGMMLHAGGSRCVEQGLLSRSILRRGSTCPPYLHPRILICRTRAATPQCAAAFTPGLSCDTSSCSPLQQYLALGLNGNLDDWVREVHALQDDGALLITQGLTWRRHRVRGENSHRVRSVEVSERLKRLSVGFKDSKVED